MGLAPLPGYIPVKPIHIVSDLDGRKLNNDGHHVPWRAAHPGDGTWCRSEPRTLLTQLLLQHPGRLISDVRMSHTGVYYLCIYYQERHCIWGDKVWYPWVVDGEVGQGLVHILQVQDKGGKGGRGGGGGGEPVLWGGGAAASLWWGRRERMCRVLEWFCRERVADVEEEDHSEKTLLREKQMTNWLVSTDV